MRSIILILSLLGATFAETSRAATAKSHRTVLGCGGYSAAWEFIRQGGTVCVGSDRNAYLVFFGGIGVSPAPVLLQGSTIILNGTSEVEGSYVGVKGGYFLGSIGAYAGGFRKTNENSTDDHGRAYILGANYQAGGLGGMSHSAEGSSDWMLIVRLN